MKVRITPHLVDLIYDAALKSFWRKNALSAFLRRADIPNLPGWLPDETKRDYLSRVFEILRGTDRGRAKMFHLAQFLTEQSTFPDLQGWEDTADKIGAAKLSVASLNAYINEQKKSLSSEKSRNDAQTKLRESQAKANSSRQTLESLSNRLAELSGELGSSKAGYEFEEWFYELMKFSEIAARKPYKVDGRQIDGSVTIGDTTYLVECKFTTEQSGATDVDVFRAKIETKADNTMGVLVSMSGYSSVAIDAASGRKTPILLLDYSHIYHILGGISTFREVLERVRRHCSQTGRSYLSVSEFSG